MTVESRHASFLGRQKNAAIRPRRHIARAGNRKIAIIPANPASGPLILPMVPNMLMILNAA
jgi:hypothetical protein